jgi:hypothetical protein
METMVMVMLQITLDLLKDRENIVLIVLMVTQPMEVLMLVMEEAVTALAEEGKVLMVTEAVLMVTEAVLMVTVAVLMVVMWEAVLIIVGMEPLKDILTPVVTQDTMELQRVDTEGALTVMEEEVIVVIVITAIIEFTFVVY